MTIANNSEVPMHRFWTFGILLLLAALTVTGCGDRRLRTQGRVLKGGKPFVAEKGQYLTVTFVPLLKDKNGKDLPPDNYYYSEVDQATGTFTAAGGDLKGIPSGKYRVQLRLMQRKKDLWGGKYTGPSLPTLDVNSGLSEIILDLDKMGTAAAKPSAPAAEASAGGS